MQTVLRLVKDDRTRVLDHFIRDLFTAVRGQAMHDHRVLRRLADDRGVQLEGLEIPKPLFALFFLPHADPHVSIDRVGVLDRREGIVG